MEILPAIDLRGGKVVRLARGDYDRQTTYGDDPVQVARQFAAAGVGWVHMVDLDAAKTGKPSNTASVRDVLQAVDLRVELGGGARSDEAVESMLELGVSRVVVGSAALADWAWFERLVGRAEMSGRIALGLDARDGLLAVHGWTEQSAVRAEKLARRVRGWPLGAIVYTDIARDGMLSGVNAAATARIVEAAGLPVIASGGVANIEDITACKQAGCAGVIVGKAWYEGRIDLGEARRAAEV